MKKLIISILFPVIFLFLTFSNAEAVSPNQVAKKWDAVSVAVDTDWFAADIGIGARFHNAVKHTFQFACPTATIINLQLKFNSITKVHNFNASTEIGINDANQFSIILHKDMTYNIQHKTATQNCAVIITESFNIDL